MQDMFLTATEKGYIQYTEGSGVAICTFPKWLHTKSALDENGREYVSMGNEFLRLTKSGSQQGNCSSTPTEVI